MLSQRLFLNFSELQVRVDGVCAIPHRLDAVDVASREPTRRARESRQCRDGVVPHRFAARLESAIVIFGRLGIHGHAATVAVSSWFMSSSAGSGALELYGRLLSGL